MMAKKKDDFDFDTADELGIQSIPKFNEKFGVDKKGAESDKNIGENKQSGSDDSSKNVVSTKQENEKKKKSDLVVYAKVETKKTGRRQLPVMINQEHLKKLGLKRLDNHFETPYKIKTLAVPPELLDSLKEISVITGVKVKHLVANLLSERIEKFNKK